MTAARLAAATGDGMDEARLIAAEERIADLLRSVDDLSAMVARQAETIDRLERRVALLMEREAGREADLGGGVVLGDERPPHW